MAEDDPRFKHKQPRAYGEKTLEQMVRDLQRRVETLESQAGTS
jgi:hypothetical protein